MHVIGSRASGGAERFYARLCLALHARGMQVTAVNPPGSSVSAMLGPDFAQTHVRMRNIWDLLAMAKIRGAAKRARPDIVQTYMGRATRLSRFSRSPIVHVARLGGFYNVKGYRHVDAWVGNTKGICDHLVRHGCPASKVFHIGNFVFDEPVVENRQTLRQRLGISSESIMIFSAGRLIARKGYQDLLGALSRLPSEISGRPWHCVVAGDGADRASLEEQTVSAGLADRLTWTGWLDAPGDYYNAADLFVCPSRWEPLGNVILEGWRHRLPVVSTASQGALELITDGEDGLLCQPENPAALSECVHRALALGDDERAALGQRGNATLEASHSEAKVTEQYVQLYEALLAKRA